MKNFLKFSSNSLIITTINKQNRNLIKFSEGCLKNNWNFIIIGDLKTPKNFLVKGSSYFNLADQKKQNLNFAKVCPINHYSRKNIGYLIAIRYDSKAIIETDDDNFPLNNFFHNIQIYRRAKIIKNNKWTNIYNFFTNKKFKNKIWPRGFPLKEIKINKNVKFEKKNVKAFIQQGLCNGNPDVDAIFRLTTNYKNFKFLNSEPVALTQKSYCTFNSQNTIWFPEAYSLLYLPSTCSMRCTDIWRSLVANRIFEEYKWPMLFDKPSVNQTRNVHDLMDDFYNEILLYKENENITKELFNINLSPKVEDINNNMVKCYKLFVKKGLLQKKEIKLLKIWLEDFEKIKNINY